MSSLVVPLGAIAGDGPRWIKARPSPHARRGRKGKQGVVDSTVDNADRRDIQATLAGNGDAYARIVKRYQQEVAAYMWRFTRQRDAWEELVQEVFVEAFLGLGGFQGRAPLLHWLRKIATRVGYRYWRQRRRQREHPTVSLEQWDDLQQAGPDRLEPLEAAELLHALLAELAPRDRLVLTLLYLQGRSVAETADLTGWSRTMVKVQAHRARGKLRVLLEQKEGLA